MMVVMSHNRALAWYGVLWRAHKGGTGNITDRWQDKEARCARLFGRVFSKGYLTNSRGAPEKRSLHQQRYSNKLNIFPRCASSLP